DLPATKPYESYMRLTACIIDDDLVSQFATRYCIQQSQGDFDILTCSSGEEGIQLCFDHLKERNTLPDHIFLDLVMEGMSGWDFLHNLENLFHDNRLPRVYVLSAFVNTIDRAIAKDHKLISGYIDKPLSRAYLEKILLEEQRKHQNSGN